jgi:hypothetical protein
MESGRVEDREQLETVLQTASEMVRLDPTEVGRLTETGLLMEGDHTQNPRHKVNELHEGF